MAVITIVKTPDPILTQKTEKIKNFGEETQSIVQNLLDTLKSAKNPEGAGLAAPQINVSKRICVVRRFIKDANGVDSIETYTLVNPEIYGESKETDIRYEGCLSIPDIYGQVERFRKVKVKAFDRNGIEFKLNASGFFARVIQHEVDHLNGILFTSKLVGKALTEKELDELEQKES